MSETFGAVKHEQTATPNADRVEKGLSLLDKLKQEAAKEITRKVTYPVDERPGWSAEYDTNISMQDYNRYTKAAQGKKKDPRDADASLFSGMALVERNTRILINGETVTDEEGDPITFRSEAFIEMFDAYSAVNALQKFMGDGPLLSTGSALYREAGFVEEAVPQDPTDA